MNAASWQDALVLMWIFASQRLHRAYAFPEGCCLCTTYQDESMLIFSLQDDMVANVDRETMVTLLVAASARLVAPYPSGLTKEGEMSWCRCALDKLDKVQEQRSCFASTTTQDRYPAKHT